MQLEEGTPLYPRRGQQDDTREGNERVGERGHEGGLQDISAAVGVLARLRAILGVEAPPTLVEATRDKIAEDRRKERESALKADVAALRKENSDLRRQLAESQGRVRALEEGLFASVRAQAEAGPPKPYESVADHDHEKVMAFIRKHKLDPGEDYDQALMSLLSTGEVKVRR